MQEKEATVTEMIFIAVHRPSRSIPFKTTSVFVVAVMQIDQRMEPKDRELSVSAPGHFKGISACVCVWGSCIKSE